MEKLLRIVKVKAAVIREGKKSEVPIEEVVPGDLVELSAGDVIPGDAFLVQSKDLYVDEAVLTGEPYHAEKQAGVVQAEAPTVILPYLPVASHLALSPLPGKFYIALAAIVVLYIASAEAAKRFFGFAQSK